VKALGMMNSDPSFTDLQVVVYGFDETILMLAGDENGSPPARQTGWRR
jgi:hypothetical protein